MTSVVGAGIVALIGYIIAIWLVGIYWFIPLLFVPLILFIIVIVASAEIGDSLKSEPEEAEIRNSEDAMIEIGKYYRDARKRL